MFGVLALIYFTLGSAYLDEFTKSFSLYLLCEAEGSGMECDRSSLDQFSYLGSGLGTTVFLLLGLIPSVNLSFVVPWIKTRRRMRRSFRSFSNRTVSQHTISVGEGERINSSKAQNHNCV